MISILFVVGRYYEDFNNEFGGTTREYHAINNAFKNNEEYELTLHVNENINETIDLMNEYDIVHVDDNKTIEDMLKRGIIPDVIGPTARSPTKNEKAKGEWKKKGLKVEDYYKAIVVRNNNSEERIDKYWNKIQYINLGVDINQLSADYGCTKKWVLWAGDATRKAKNFKMFIDIMDNTKLPPGYSWRVMSGYKLEDYINTLKNTAVIINTSLNETFCFAMFEANACGVPSIYKEGLHNPKGHKQKLSFHPKKNIQVKYTPEAYGKAIRKLLKNKKNLNSAMRDARKYAEDNGSYKNIIDSFGKIYEQAYINKFGNVRELYG